MDVSHADTEPDGEHGNEADDHDHRSPGPTDGQKFLKGVVAYVDVWSARENMSCVIKDELERLGATVVKRFSSRVTHAIYKEGNQGTVDKAQKAKCHLLSVQWVDRCKHQKKHVAETDFPAYTPKQMNPLFAKRKRAKMMIPTSYEEDLARNAKRVARKQKKLDAMNRLKSSNSIYSTPTSSPLAAILVHDTQPRSPDSSFRLTPIRLTIPETPPSMREKMRQLRLAKQAVAASASVSQEPEKDEERELEAELRHENLKGLQRTLFTGSKDLNLEVSLNSSTEYSPVFLPTASEKGFDSQAGSPATSTPVFLLGGSVKQSDSQKGSPDTSITEDILKIAENINTTLNHPASHGKPRLFGVDSDENLLSSQEIGQITNKIVLKQTDVEDSNTVQNGQTEKVLEESKRKSTVSKHGKRNTRRLSVQQALEELDHTMNMLHDDVEELDEDPLPPKVSNVSIGSGKDGDETLKSSHDKSSRGKRKSCGKSLNQDNKENDRKRRRSKASITPVVNDNDKDTGESGEVEKSSDKVTKPKKQKRTMKKKLMSLTDLNDQHSVLVSPTKYSDDTNRAALIDTTMTKKGKKRKQSAKESKQTNDIPSSTAISEEATTDDNSKTVKKKTTARGRKRKGSTNKENVLQNDPVSLADETHTEQDRQTSHIGNNSTLLPDNTTQLNLTKDTSVSVNLQDSTLSMSMSRAYPDNTMTAISNRKSIDEFSVSQRRKYKRQRQIQRFLSSVAENESVSTDSDNSCESRRARARANPGQMETSAVRKNMRPSIVMTSLHSHEQDVVISVVKKLGGFVIAESVNETTTHVVCGEARRTLNILQCLARGSWLLSKEWVLKSLEAGSWVAEAEFECSDLFPTCKIARLEKEKSCGFYRQSLFMGLGHIYVSGRSTPPRQHIVQLIKLCGGQVTGSKEKGNVYVGSDYHPGLTCLKTAWILDCISEHQLLPMDKYMLDRPKRESSPAY